LLWAIPAWSRPGYLSQLPPRVRKCQVCHLTRSGMGGLNPFGKAFRERGSVQQLMALDPDGDGFTTRQEFDAGTNPGNPRSYPGAPPEIPVLPLTLVLVGMAGGGLFLWRLRRYPHE